MASYGRISREVIERIKYLRQRGYSLPEISGETGISRTSVFRYIRNVQILPEYLSEWAGKRGGSRKIKLSKVRKALQEGELLAKDLTSKEKLLILCALYWAEGNKADFILTNTDPNLISVFVNILREVLKLKDEQLRVSIRLYEDLDKKKCLDFWSGVVGISKDKFLSTYILPGRKKVNWNMGCVEFEL